MPSATKEMRGVSNGDMLFTRFRAVGRGLSYSQRSLHRLPSKDGTIEDVGFGDEKAYLLGETLMMRRWCNYFCNHYNPGGDTHPLVIRHRAAHVQHSPARLTQMVRLMEYRLAMQGRLFQWVSSDKHLIRGANPATYAVSNGHCQLVQPAHG